MNRLNPVQFTFVKAQATEADKKKGKNSLAQLDYFSEAFNLEQEETQSIAQKVKSSKKQTLKATKTINKSTKKQDKESNIETVIFPIS